MLRWLAQTAVALYAHGVVYMQRKLALSKKDTVYEVIMDFAHPNIEIEDGQNLEVDLDLDRLDRLNLVMSLEEIFKRELPDELIDNPNTTVANVVDAVAE